MGRACRCGLGLSGWCRGLVRRRWGGLGGRCGEEISCGELGEVSLYWTELFFLGRRDRNERCDNMTGSDLRCLELGRNVGVLDPFCSVGEILVIKNQSNYRRLV